MQADLILHVYSVLRKTGYPWYPYTLVYASSYGAFELFVRASTKEGFENLKRLLKIDTADQLVESFTQNSKGYQYGTPFGDLPFYPNRLMNFEELWRP